MAADLRRVAAGVELRLLEAKRVSTYRLAIELLYLRWYGKGEPNAASQAGYFGDLPSISKSGRRTAVSGRCLSRITI